MIIIGYSGHAYVVCGILQAAGNEVTGYCDTEEKANNPFGLNYMGTELSEKAQSEFKANGFFIAIGDNKIRRKIFETLAAQQMLPANAVHPSAIKDSSVTIEENGVMISAGVIINPLAKIGKGVICNSGCIIEHECSIGDFAHIGPGAVICGNVTVGENSFVGAGAVVKQGISIGKNVTVGAGAVVVKNIADGLTVKGCPAQ